MVSVKNPIALAVLLFCATASHFAFAGTPVDPACDPAFAALGITPFHLAEKIAFPGDEPFSLREQSAQNIKTYADQLGTLSTEEAQLVKAVEALPLSVSSRTKVGLEQVVAQGGDLPRNALIARGIKVHSDTPPTEDILYGAGQWTFATISAAGWKGPSSYGNTVLDLAEDYWKTNSWATPTSGLKIYEDYSGLVRGVFSMRGIPKADLPEARKAFQSKMVVPENYSRWIAYDIISYLRSQPEAVRKEFFSADTQKLVQLLNQNRLGYLEGKLPGIPPSAFQKSAAPIVAETKYTPEKLHAFFKGQKESPNFDSYSVQNYSGKEYEVVNADLILGKPLDVMTQELVDGVDQSIASAPFLPEDIVLYRGEMIDRLTPPLTPGSIIEYKNYFSTSADQKAALKFTHKESILYEVHIPKGAKVRGVYMPEAVDEPLTIEAEQEILLARNHKFKILSVTDLDPKSVGAHEITTSLKKVVIELVP